MDQLIFASLSHTHYWYEVGMLKVPVHALYSWTPLYYRLTDILWGGMLPDFFFCSLSPVQQTTSGIGHRVNYFFGLASNTLNVRNNNGIVQYTTINIVGLSSGLSP